MIREEVVIQFGTDATQMPKGIDQATGYIEKWTEKVRNMAQGYTGWWAGELKKREEMEVASAVRAAERSNQARRLLRARASVQEQRQQSVNEEISGGYIPHNLKSTASAIGGEAGAMAGAGFMKNRFALMELGHVARSSADSLAAGMSPLRVISMESPRIIQSLTMMGFSFKTLAALLGTVGLVVAGAAGAGAIIASDFRAAQARRQEGDSAQGLKVQSAGLGERLKGTISDLADSGTISGDEAKRISGMLGENPNSSKISAVQKYLVSLSSKKYTQDDKNAQDIEAADKAYEQQSKQLDEILGKQRTEAELTDDMAQKNEYIAFLRKNVEVLDKNSVEYHQARLRLVGYELGLEKDKTELGEIQKKQAAEKKVVAEAALRIEEVHQREQEKFMPTLDELAHHGAFTGQARSISRLDRKIKRDFEFGNVKGAAGDIASRDKIYDSLAARGIIAERSEAREIKDINKQMAIRLAAMGTSSAPLVITPKMK